jgi:hypothetical protein
MPKHGAAHALQKKVALVEHAPVMPDPTSYDNPSPAK